MEQRVDNFVLIELEFHYENSKLPELVNSHWYLRSLVLRNLDITWYDNLDIREIVPYHLLKSPLHLICKDIEWPFRIISLAIIPNKLDMVQNFLNGAVLSAFELILYLQQIHWVLNHEGIVI